MNVTLDWKGPYTLRTAEECARFDPPGTSGVYLWVAGETRSVSYVGQSANLHRRFHEHVVSILGGGYLLYDPEVLRRTGKHQERYRPTWGAPFRDFVADWSQRADLAHKNLLAYEFFWAFVDGDAKQRETVESALIHAARQRGFAHQNPKPSRLPQACDQIVIHHVFPKGIVIDGIANPT